MCTRDARVSSSWLLVVMLVLLVPPGRAAADEGRVSGFTTNATGELSGHVKDNDGDPIVGVEVHITSAEGERVVKTDKDGRYKIDLGKAEGQKFVFVRQVARINGQALETSALETGEEVFEIREAEKPKVMPKPRSGTNVIPDYSDEARDKDVWARAWLLLEISSEGVVTRIKLLHAPGYGLDEIAMRAAGDLSFEPALSPSGRPVPALVVWTYEWPSYWWMIAHKYSPKVVPEEATSVPCAKEPSNRSRLRDCTQVDLSKEHELPWVPATQTTGRILLSSGKWAKRSYWYEDSLGWVLTGGGAVVVGTSLYLILGADDIEREARMEIDPVREAQKLDQADLRRWAGYVLTAIGVGMVGIGTARLIIHTDGAEEASAALAWRF